MSSAKLLLDRLRFAENCSGHWYAIRPDALTSISGKGAVMTTTLKGGELGRLLRNLSGALRDEARTRSEIESRQAWTVNSAHDFPP